MPPDSIVSGKLSLVRVANFQGRVFKSEETFSELQGKLGRLFHAFFQVRLRLRVLCRIHLWHRKHEDYLRQFHAVMIQLRFTFIFTHKTCINEESVNAIWSKCFV